MGRRLLRGSPSAHHQESPAEILIERTVFGLAPELRSRTLVASAQRSARRAIKRRRTVFVAGLLTYTRVTSKRSKQFQGLDGRESSPTFCVRSSGAGTAGQLLFAMVLVRALSRRAFSIVAGRRPSRDHPRSGSPGGRGRPRVCRPKTKGGPVQAGFVLTVRDGGLHVGFDRGAALLEDSDRIGTICPKDRPILR